MINHCIGPVATAPGTELTGNRTFLPKEQRILGLVVYALGSWRQRSEPRMEHHSEYEADQERQAGERVERPPVLPAKID